MIDEMCADARQRVASHVNRSTGQHLRAMKSRHVEAPTTADIFAMAMESPTAHKFAEWLCKEAGVAFPPQQMEAVCQSQL